VGVTVDVEVAVGLGEAVAVAVGLGGSGVELAAAAVVAAVVGSCAGAQAPSKTRSAAIRKRPTGRASDRFIFLSLLRLVTWLRRKKDRARFCAVLLGPSR